MTDLGYANAEEGEPVRDPELEYQLDALTEEVESGSLPGEVPLGSQPVDDQYSADSL